MSDVTPEEQLHDVLFDVLRAAKEVSDSAKALVDTGEREGHGSNVDVCMHRLNGNAWHCARLASRAAERVREFTALPARVGELRADRWRQAAADALGSIESFPAGVARWITSRQDKEPQSEESSPIWTGEQWKVWAAACGAMYRRILDLREAFPPLALPIDRARDGSIWQDHCREITGIESFALLEIHQTSESPAYRQALRAILKKYEGAVITPRFLKGRIECYQRSWLMEDRGPDQACPPGLVRGIATTVHSFFTDAHPLGLEDAPDPPGTDAMGPRAAYALLEKLRKSLIRRLNDRASGSAARSFVQRSDAARRLGIDAGTVKRWIDKYPSIAESDATGSRVDINQLRNLLETSRATQSRDDGIRDRARDEANRDAWATAEDERRPKRKR